MILAQGGDGSPPADTTSHFIHDSDGQMRWDPKTDGKKAVDGLGWASSYRADVQTDPAFNYWATSNTLSLTPVNGWRMKKVYTSFGPGDYMQFVDAMPIKVEPYGSSGSTTISATLKGEAGTEAYRGGLDIGIAKTWDTYEGSAGGGVLNDGTHFGVWQAGNKAGSSATKSATGLEVWKVPPDKNVVWGWGNAWEAQK